MPNIVSPTLRAGYSFSNENAGTAGHIATRNNGIETGVTQNKEEETEQEKVGQMGAISEISEFLTVYHSENPLVEAVLKSVGDHIDTLKLIQEGNLAAGNSSSSMQNWCAKCNTSFRMTGDLIYHMRTHHRGNEGVPLWPMQVGLSHLSILNSGFQAEPKETFDEKTPFQTIQSGNNTQKQMDSPSESAFSSSTSSLSVPQKKAASRSAYGKSRQEKLKCNICGERFREIYHLSRNLSSHN